MRFNLSLVLCFISLTASAADRADRIIVGPECVYVPSQCLPDIPKPPPDAKK